MLVILIIISNLIFLPDLSDLIIISNLIFFPDLSDYGFLALTFGKKQEVEAYFSHIYQRIQKSFRIVYRLTSSCVRIGNVIKPPMTSPYLIL